MGRRRSPEQTFQRSKKPWASDIQMIYGVFASHYFSALWDAGGRFHVEPTVYTIGHSTHTGAEFVAILEAYRIEIVVDVRSIPRSRHNPQFNKEELEQSLREHGIAYLHLAALGGLRHTTKASINTAWKNASFRGFADYMQTVEFAEGIEQLLEIVRAKRVAIMCAEAVPWRCHRSLIGDALLVRKFHVVDIMSDRAGKPHILTPWARIKGLEITYPKTET